MLHCIYRNNKYFKKLSNPFKFKSISLFYLNICSLQIFFGNFHIKCIIFNELNINMDIIAVTKSLIGENVSCPIISSSQIIRLNVLLLKLQRVVLFSIYQ